MPDIRRYLEALRALSFGGLVAGGIGAIIFFRFGHYFPYVSQYWFIAICAALGAGAQQAIQGVLSFLFKPVFKFLMFHEKLYEIRRLANEERISHERAQELIDKLCEKRFLE